MAKNMARIENGQVVNIEWSADSTPESDTLKDIADRPVDIGDTYENGKFYRKGIEVMSYVEDMENALAILLGGDAV